MTISHHDWIAGSSVHPAVFDRWPAYRVVLVAGHVDQPSLAEIAQALHVEAHESARNVGSDETDPHVLLWQTAYRDFGVKPRMARPSVDALMRRAASERGLPQIDVLVDLYNAISVLHRVPIGGEDLDRYEGPARLVIAAGDETFLTVDDGEPLVEHPVEGEPVWIDDQGVTCRRWNWRQTTRTAIHTGTVRVGFIIDSLDGPDHAGATRAAEQLAAHVRDPLIRVIDAADPGTRS